MPPAQIILECALGPSTKYFSIFPPLPKKQNRTKQSSSKKRYSRPKCLKISLCISTRGKKFYISSIIWHKKITSTVSDWKFSVFTLSYVNTAFYKLAFRIHKCCIIKQRYKICKLCTVVFSSFYNILRRVCNQTLWCY